MKIIASILCCLGLAFAALTADKPATGAFLKPSLVTNGMWIWADGGLIYNGVAATITYRKNVRVADPQMFLQCDLLTEYHNTNTSQMEVIIAEGNVMLLTGERQMLGDRAVYTASDDVVRVTGEAVLLADSRATLIGTNFVFDRKLGNFYNIGPVTTILDTGGTASPADILKGRPEGNRTNSNPGRKTP